LFVPGSNFDFLLAGKNSLAYFNQGKCVDEWQTARTGAKQILFDRARSRFLLLFDDRLECFSPGTKAATVFEGGNLNCMELTKNNTALTIGTRDGYIELDADSLKPRSDLQKKLPCTDIRCIRQIGESVWFGTPRGALALDGDGRINYYASKRWLVDDNVIDISIGPDNSVLALCESGLSIIHFEPMTLEQKAEHFDKLTRKRHMRHG
jgi:hypothetical protein